MTVRPIVVRVDFGARWGPARWYELCLAELAVVSRTVTTRLQNGLLRVYMLTIVVTTVGLAGYTLISRGMPVWAPRPLDITVHEVGLAVLMLLAALMAVRTTSRLAAVVALGVVGYGVALVYLEYGAPDLAMTQILIETLTVILFVLVFYFLPRFARFSDARDHARDAAVAIAAGGLMTLLVLVGSGIRFDPAIPKFYADESLPSGHGRNVVNVILVDFRAVDTLGEITVLSLAALGVYALLKLRPARDRTPPVPSEDDGRTEDRWAP